jgi:HAD superfamily hydrolase (TIGR01662 family)
MSRYRLIVFDFDDTVVHLQVNWGGVKQDAVKLAAREKIFVDKSMHLVPLGNLISKTSTLKNELDQIYRIHEKEALDHKAYAAFPHMVSLIRELKGEGYKLAVASGNHSSNVRGILARLGVLPSFDIICGRDNIWNNKPAPDQLLFVMQRTGIDKDETIFIGDSEFDEECAKAAGVMFFKVSKPPSPEDAVKFRKMLE